MHCAWALALCLIGHGACAAPPDVRVLVDISASMKASDPDNLRVPAVGALIERLPEGSRAGVWTFGRYVNMLVPYGEVGAAWRVAALDAVGAIDSVAVHADLESAVDTATWNWAAPDAGGARHLLVITDGAVELPNGADENRHSRERILTTLLPRLSAADVQIHAVALGAAADGDLLNRLATETGGHYRHADAAMLPALLGELLHRQIAPPPARAPAPWTETAPDPMSEYAPVAEGTGPSARDWTRIGLGVMIVNLVLGAALLLAYGFLPRPAQGATGDGAAPLAAGEVTAVPEVRAEPAHDPGSTAAATPGETEAAAKALADAPGAAAGAGMTSASGGDPRDSGASGGQRYEALEGIEIDGIDVDRIDLDFSDSGRGADHGKVAVAGGA